MIKHILLFFFVTIGFVFSQSIDSVLIVSDPEFVFSYKPFDQKTGTIHLTVYDINGQPVGADVPIGISLRGGVLKGTTLFKSTFSDDTTSTNYFYFRTDANGEITADFYPYTFVPYTFDGIKNNYLNNNPDATEEEILEEYKRFTQLNIVAWTVSFTDPNDEQTATTQSSIPRKTNSVLPVLYGHNAVIVNGTGRDGFPYLFTAEKYNAPPVTITLQALDMFNNPLPEGCMLYFYAFWGHFTGNNILTVFPDDTSAPSDYSTYNSSFRGGGSYYVKVGAEGKITLTYYPPPTTMVPFTHWANTMLNYNNFRNRDEAWQAYTGNDISIPGTAVFYRFQGATPSSSYWTGYELTYTNLSIDSSTSTIPALVSLDQVNVDTDSKRNVYYAFASRNYSESVPVKLTGFDSFGRLVPKGTPVALYLNWYYLPDGEKGMITGRTVDGFWGGPNDRFYIVLFEENGETEVEYRPPLIDFSLNYYEGEDYRGLTYDENYSGLFQFFPVPFYGWFGNEEMENNVTPHWFVSYYFGSSANPFVVLPKSNTYNIFPVVVGAKKARIVFRPPTLWPLQYLSTVDIFVEDPFGIPAPQGSNIHVTTSSGTLQGEQQEVDAIVTGKAGKATVIYFSPTRSVTFTKGSSTISVFNSGTKLRERDITLIGSAVAWHDFNLSKWILGFDLVEFIENLNPLKALGALKAFVEYAEKTGQQWNDFYMKIADGVATPDDYRAYEQSWQQLAQHIRHLAETIPNTSLTGPDLSAGELFNSLTTTGLQHTLKNTLEANFIKGPQKKAITDFFIYNLSLLFPQTTNKPIAGVTSDTTYSLHASLNSGKLEFLTDLYVIPSETGMYEMYGYRFRQYDVDSLVLHGAIQVGDQWPMGEFTLPKRLSLFGYPDQAVVYSTGFFEITDINSQENYIEGTVVGYTFNPPTIHPVLAFSKKVSASGDTVTDAFDTRLILPPNVVTDSTHLFLLRTSPPLPLIENDSIVIETAQTVGSMAPDSTLQTLIFTTPAELQLKDTTRNGSVNPWQAYRFDADNQQWLSISDAQYQNDSIFVIPITSTGIYGVGREGMRHNESPLVTSFPDTIIVMNTSLSLPFKATDPEGQPLTIWAQSDKPEVSVSVQDTLLQVVPAQNWSGIATISLLVADGQDTAISSFRLNVVDVTAIKSSEGMPREFALFQNFPNPFNGTTTIQFTTPRATKVTILIFNTLGQKVRTLLNNALPAGRYRVRWDGTNDQGNPVSSGLYIYVLKTPGWVKSKRMLFLK